MNSIRLIWGPTLAALCCLWLMPGTGRAEPAEIRVYQGQKLHPFHRTYDNSIRGPQTVDAKKLRFKIDGLVAKPQRLTYARLLRLPHVRRVVTMPCVEGWSERLLYDAVRLKDVIMLAVAKPGVKTVIFHAADGYTSSLTWAWVQKHEVLLGFRINGLVLDKKRGFPFQVIAPGKLGYKWVKWVVAITLSDKPYRGYWERRGYSNEANAN
ncbi:MAG: molybdopterin-dependent oxidoreductase [Proteobacteria bacterium]|nr:molybdopterin-dependent oxidoreductase [Pseudomonadota bacterium]